MPSPVPVDADDRRAPSPDHIRSLLAGSAAIEGLELVLWPAEDDSRRRCRDAGVPCLLVLDADTPAPVSGPMEDWVRAPVALADIDARCRSLRLRQPKPSLPVMDPNGALWFDGARVDLPRGHQALAQLLLDRYQGVVRRDELLDAYAAAGGSRSDEALKAAIVRLTHRLAAVGLALRTIRGRGCLLEPSRPADLAARAVTSP